MKYQVLINFWQIRVVTRGYGQNYSLQIKKIKIKIHHYLTSVAKATCGLDKA